MRDLSEMFDRDRLGIYSRLFVLGYIGAIIALFATAQNMVDPTGKPLGYDYITFWSAGRLALDGNAALRHATAEVSSPRRRRATRM